MRVISIKKNIQKGNYSYAFALASEELVFHFKCDGSSEIYSTNQARISYAYMPCQSE